jgi:hypothetical protein
MSNILTGPPLDALDTENRAKFASYVTTVLILSVANNDPRIKAELLTLFANSNFADRSLQAAVDWLASIIKGP